MTKKYKQLKDTWRIKAGEEWTQLNEDLTLYLHYGTQTLEKESVIKENPSWFQEITEPKQSFKRWRAKKGQPYFYVDGMGEIIRVDDIYDSIDNYRYLTFNYFPTREEAESYKARQEAIGRVTHAIIEANEGWEPNWEDGTQIKYRIIYLHSIEDLEVNNDAVEQNIVTVPYCRTNGIALSIISSHKEDLDLIFNLKK